MTINQFLKENNKDTKTPIQWAYYPHQNHKIIIRFWNNDKTGRDKKLSALLKRLGLPFTIHARKTGFFYLIQPYLCS